MARLGRWDRARRRDRVAVTSREADRSVGLIVECRSDIRTGRLGGLLPEEGTDLLRKLGGGALLPRLMQPSQLYHVQLFYSGGTSGTSSTIGVHDEWR